MPPGTDRSTIGTIVFSPSGVYNGVPLIPIGRAFRDPGAKMFEQQTHRKNIVGPAFISGPSEGILEDNAFNAKS